MKLENLKDILDNQAQEIILNLVNNFGQKLIAVFELREKTLIGLYSISNFIVQDEQNRKTFLLKGKKIDLLITEAKSSKGLDYSFDKLNNYLVDL